MACGEVGHIYRGTTVLFYTSKLVQRVGGGLGGIIKYTFTPLDYNSIQFNSLLFATSFEAKETYIIHKLCTVYNNEIMLTCFHDIISCLLN